MATQVFLRGPDLGSICHIHRGTNTAKLDTTTSGWFPNPTSTSRSSSSLWARATNTVTGPTNGVEVGTSTTAYEWITHPVDQDVTISGTVTANIWANESSMNANVAINFYVDKMAATDGALTRIVTSARTTEVSTSMAVNNFTASPTSTAVNKGDRLRIVIFGDDGGGANMASGFTFTVDYSGPTPAADGDTYITFNETFGFQTTDPVATLGLTGHILNIPSSSAVNFGTVGTAVNARAQSFQIPSTATIDEVEMSLGKSGTPTDNVVASIQADSAGEPSGTALTSGTYPMTSLTSTATPVRIAMSSISLTGSTTYWLVAERSGAADDNSPKWGSASANPYPYDSSVKTSGTWASSATDDYHFAILEAGAGEPSNKIYLTNTASAVSTADEDYEAWTSRGNGAFSVSEGLVAGWTTPLQVFPTPTSWFTRQLQAFTLSGLVKINVRAAESFASGNTSLGCEIARVDADGTNATVWGYANRDAATTSGGAGEVATTETAYTVYVSGDDLAFTDGQRIRVRIFADDCADIPMAASGSLTVWFDGPTGGASGDTYLIFPQTLTEALSGTTLVVQDATHAHAADNLDLVRALHVLTVQDAAHAQVADSVLLVPDLAVQDALHAHAAESPTLTLGAVTLVVQDAVHAHTAESPTLSVPGEGPSPDPLLVGYIPMYSQR